MPKPLLADTRLSRRRVLSLGTPLFLSCGLLPTLAQAAINPERKLSFLNLHTGETVETVYHADGQYVAEGLADIDHILRDWRTGEAAAMDRRLLDLLHDLRRGMDSTEPFHVISGYRSPKTNQQLSSKSNGVAKKSLHMRGMAIDISLPGRDLTKLRDKALALKRGGVGYYRKSGFIHVDVGRVRRW